MKKHLDIPVEAVKEFCQRYQVRELALFGSALREDFNAESDFDILVEFEEGAEIGFLTFARMQRELSAILGCCVDLVPKRGLKPRIRQTVLSSAKVLYAT